MAKKASAGILLYRFRRGQLEVLLIHPGGPYWARKDAGAWSIPKGEIEAGHDAFDTAKREFHEETGFEIDGTFIALAALKQPGGKVIHAWCVEGDVDADAIVSNTFAMEWPPGSGIQRDFPEADRGGWFTVPVAIEKLLRGQRGFVDELQRRLGLFAANDPARNV
jgi:predicted NUDIX family NTP pyrophosphohydrolase